MTVFASGSATDVGRVRQANEDSMLTTEHLFVVADGMGGHRGGAVASRMAVEAVKEFFTGNTTESLVEAIEKANESLIERSQAEPELEGMGTTLVALALVVGSDHDEERDLLGVVNIGDSRLYLLKEGNLEQITEDHSLVATLERQGRLTRAEAAVHPQRNVLTRALGIDDRVLVDSWEILPFVGDRYLLCSDGLFNEVDHGRIEATLRKLADPEEAAHELVRLANEHGGRDNITCVVVDVVDNGKGSPASDDEDRIAHAVHGPERAIAAGTALVESAGSDGSKHDEDPRDDGSGSPDEGSGVDSDAATDAKSRAGSPRVGWMTWRLLLFVFAFLVIVSAVIGSIIYAGTATYYVGFDGDTVAIFRGRPGGVLWIDPQLVERTDLERDEVPAQYLADIDKGRSQASIDDARRYVDNIERLAPPPTGSTRGGGDANGPDGNRDADRPDNPSTTVTTSSATAPPS